MSAERRAFYNSPEGRAERAARYGGDPTPSAGRPGGLLAYFDGFCWSCDRRIVRHESRVVQRKGSWVCVSCAGVSDE